MQDIIVGTPLAGRRQSNVQEIIGMFVNTLPIRNFPAPDKTFTGFLQEVREETLRVFENQDIRYEDIAARAAVHRDTSRNPLFDVVFLLENFEFAEIDIPGLQWANYDYEVNTAKFDLTLSARETTASLRFSFEYCTRLFKQETIERFIGYFKRLTHSIIEKPGAEIAALDILPEAEKKKICYDFNNTAVEYPGYPADSMIHRLFIEQAGKTPHRIAAIAVEHRQTTLHPVFVTYAALNEKSDSIARFLQAKGVQAGNFVGISLRRSNLMTAAIFGILKAGAAYIPIDPDYPEERIQYILIDSGARFLFTSCDLSSMCKSEPQRLPEISPQKKVGSESGFLSAGCTNAIAYMIYTSGTTGKPKGVLVEHRSLANLCSWHNRYFQVKESDIASQYAGIGFDAAVWEIFPYLLRGAALHIIGDETRLDIDKLGAYYDRHNITIGFLPTQVCRQFMRRENSSLRVLLTGGDKLQSFYKRRYVLYNNYGPTENTVVTTCFQVEEYEENIPIGKPIDNNRVYILGKDNFYIQPIGAAGEL
jgi:non-ribosomal peptide synthetase component F